MEDVFYEQLVADSRPMRSRWLRAGMIVLVILVLALELLFWQIGQYIFILTLFLAVIFFMYFWRRTSCEYEYSFTDGQLDVDVIFNKQGRKRLLTLDCRKITLVAPVSEPRFQRLYEQPAAVHIVATDRNPEQTGVYVLLGSSADKSLKLEFQPDERMLRLLKRYAPRAVMTAGDAAKHYSL